jgi:hypothetical protein
VLQPLGEEVYYRAAVFKLKEQSCGHVCQLAYKCKLGCFSETGFHIGMDRTFFVYGADTIAEVKLLISPYLH